MKVLGGSGVALRPCLRHAAATLGVAAAGERPICNGCGAAQAAAGGHAGEHRTLHEGCKLLSTTTLHCVTADQDFLLLSDFSVREAAEFCPAVSLQDEAERLRRVERQHIMEIGRLQGQIDTAAEVNKALQASDNQRVKRSVYAMPQTLSRDSCDMWLHLHDCICQLWNRKCVLLFRCQCTVMQARLELFEDKTAETASQAQSIVADLEHERQQTSKLRAEVRCRR